MATVSYAKDVDRVCLLRESLEQTDTELEHVVIVASEDLSLFRSRLGSSVEIVTTAEVLPASVEQRRRSPRRRRNPRYWLPNGRGLPGWFVQQLTKLEWAASDRASDITLFIDSDQVALKTIDREFLIAPNGAPYLFVNPYLDAEMGGWTVAGMQFLGCPLQGTPLLNFTVAPMVIVRSVVRNMCQHISDTHRGPWIDAFIEHNVFECATYGSFAAWLETETHCEQVDRPVVGVVFPEDLVRADEILAQQAASGDHSFFTFQSSHHVDVDEYSAVLRAAFARSRS